MIKSFPSQQISTTTRSLSSPLEEVPLMLALEEEDSEPDDVDDDELDEDDDGLDEDEVDAELEELEDDDDEEEEEEDDVKELLELLLTRMGSNWCNSSDTPKLYGSDDARVAHW